MRPFRHEPSPTHQIFPAVSDVNARSSLNLLPYIDGAGWQAEKTCLKGTRQSLLDDMREWVFSEDDNAPTVSVVCEAMGTGKSALAHSAASIFQGEGVLGSSFFLDRETAGRNSSRAIWTTVARDLASKNPQYANALARLLEGDRSLASTASPTQQLDMIIQAYTHITLPKPVVIVVDALDEVVDGESLEAFLDAFGVAIHQFPRRIRFLFTTRPEGDIVRAIQRWPSSRSVNLDINGPNNRADIDAYSRRRLQYVAERRRLHGAWPDAMLTAEFIRRADGLFVWVYTLSKFLSETPQPDKKLRMLLDSDSDRQSSDTAEVQMDSLYGQILHSLPWSDNSFSGHYQIVLGTILAIRIPLSVDALLSLHQLAPEVDDYFEDTLQRLASVITGAGMKQKKPIQLLHASFADFVTTRARLTDNTRRFSVDRQEHSRRLLPLCLSVLERELTLDTPGVGFVISFSDMLDANRRLLNIPVVVLSEQALYACRFWMDHLLDHGERHQSTVLSMLHNWVSSSFAAWVDVMVSVRSCRTMEGFEAIFHVC